MKATKLSSTNIEQRSFWSSKGWFLSWPVDPYYNFKIKHNWSPLIG